MNVSIALKVKQCSSDLEYWLVLVMKFRSGSHEVQYFHGEQYQYQICLLYRYPIFHNGLHGDQYLRQYQVCHSGLHGAEIYVPQVNEPSQLCYDCR